MRTTETTGNPFFDRFWAAYPKKVGKEKARRAFEKVHPTEDLEIHSAPCNLAESKTMGG